MLLSYSVLRLLPQYSREGDAYLKQPFISCRNRVDAASVLALLLSLPILMLYLVSGYTKTLFQIRDASDTDALAVSGKLDTGVFTSLYEEAFASLGISASHASLMTLDGKLLFGKNENERAGMASTTKIMTACLAAEYIQSVGYEATTAVSENASGVEGSSIYLEAGEQVRLIDLLYATMLASANDAATALAEAVAGDVGAFVEQMNLRADALGLIATHFENPHGLSSEGHYTTAYELGLITAHAMQNELFRQVVATKSYTFSTEGITRSFANHNRMLLSYEGTVGVKTGFTKATGRCLVTAAERGGVSLVAVTLSAPNDWIDHEVLLDYGFSVLERVVYADKGEISFSLPAVGGVSGEVLVHNAEALFAVLPKERGEVSCSIELPAFVYAPIEQGMTLGYAILKENGEEVSRVALTASEDLPMTEYKKSIADRLRELLGIE